MTTHGEQAELYVKNLEARWRGEESSEVVADQLSDLNDVQVAQVHATLHLAAVLSDLRNVLEAK